MSGTSRQKQSIMKDLEEKTLDEIPSTETLGRQESEELWEDPVPTTVVPIYKRRLVLVKIGSNFLRIGTGIKPVVSKLKPPLFPTLNIDEVERLLAAKGSPKPVPETFDFPAFTFVADESATVTESWYRRTRIFFHIRLSVQRWGAKGPTEYLCSSESPDHQHANVTFDQHPFGSWWRLTAVANGLFVAESLHLPGRCMAAGPAGLCLSAPLTDRERAGIAHGRFDKERTVSVITLPDFAVTQLGVSVD